VEIKRDKREKKKKKEKREEGTRKGIGV